MNTDHYSKDPQKYIEELQAAILMSQQRLEAQKQRLAAQKQSLSAQRQEIVQQYGPEFLALIEGDPRAKVFITNVVEKLVFQDDQGNVISKTDGVPIGQIVNVRLVDPPSDSECQDSSGVE